MESWPPAAVRCATGSLGAHVVGYWLEPSGAAASPGHAWLELLPALAVGATVALLASLAVETREILRSRTTGSVPGWLYLVLPGAAFLVQEHVERAAATAQLPVDTLAQPAVLVVTRLLSRATVAIARRIARRGGCHVDRPVDRPARTDPRPRRVVLLQPVGRGPPALAVP